jgi:flavin reductase (DIM6/NTAB) family NADH-FMN oxidoreductase RutF
MHISFDSIRGSEIYQWMSGLIVPRPIAWVATRSSDGINNLAPFSYFNAVGTRPPTLMFCPANRADGSEKDTLVNIRQTREFVVHIVTEPFAAAMDASAADFPPDVDEFEMVGLETAPSTQVNVARIRGAAAAFECRLHTVTSLATGPGAANIVIGEIVGLHVDERYLTDDGHLNLDSIETIARYCGKSYLRSRERFEIGKV